MFPGSLDSKTKKNINKKINKTKIPYASRSLLNARPLLHNHLFPPLGFHQHSLLTLNGGFCLRLIMALILSFIISFHFFLYICVCVYLCLWVCVEIEKKKKRDIGSLNVGTKLQLRC